MPPAPTDPSKPRKPPSSGSRRFKQAMRPGIDAAKAKAPKTNAVVAANDAMRQALDADLMARMGR